MSNFKESPTREVFIEDIDMQMLQYFLKYFKIPRLPENENFEKTAKSLY